MDLQENKVFGTKLTAEQIKKIEQILNFSEVSMGDLKTKGDVFNVILDNFSFEKESEPEKSEEAQVKTPEKSEKETSKPKIETVNVKISEQLSLFHQELINKFIQDEKVISFFERRNEDGKFNGVYNTINTEDKEQNILNILVGVFTGSAQKMALNTNVIKEKDLKQMINVFISKEE